VERNAKFPSSQTEAGQSTAESATPNEDHHEDIKLTSFTSQTSFQKHLSLFFYFSFLTACVNSTLLTSKLNYRFDRKGAAKNHMAPSKSVESLNVFKQTM
jgi:hypothetical protein